MQTMKMQAENRLQFKLALFTCVLAFCVILLGAYVRLSDAGLGCPDWPGCYGQIDVPSSDQEIHAANEAYPQRLVEPSKAWKEMIHRYLAGSLGLAILALAVLALRNRKNAKQPIKLPMALVGLVAFQALLGMWTVTLLVKPAIVTAHLLGGLATLALLVLLCLRIGVPLQDGVQRRTPPRLFYLSLVGLIVLIAQISLGGWTSTNYAAIGCSEFPTCHSGQWWPTMDFNEAFVLWRGLGVNYEFGVLDNDARIAIHMTHRIGALITAFYLGFLSWWLIRYGSVSWIRKMGLWLTALIVLQVALGITNVVALLPLYVAVAHNGVAALLLITMVTLLWGINGNR